MDARRGSSRVQGMRRRARRPVGRRRVQPRRSRSRWRSTKARVCLRARSGGQQRWPSLDQAVDINRAPSSVLTLGGSERRGRDDVASLWQVETGTAARLPASVTLRATSTGVAFSPDASSGRHGEPTDGSARVVGRRSVWRSLVSTLVVHTNQRGSRRFQPVTGDGGSPRASTAPHRLWGGRDYRAAGPLLGHARRAVTTGASFAPDGIACVHRERGRHGTHLVVQCGGSAASGSCAHAAGGVRGRGVRPAAASSSCHRRRRTARRGCGVWTGRPWRRSTTDARASRLDVLAGRSVAS